MRKGTRLDDNFVLCLHSLLSHQMVFFHHLEFLMNFIIPEHEEKSSEKERQEVGRKMKKGRERKNAERMREKIQNVEP